MEITGKEGKKNLERHGLQNNISTNKAKGRYGQHIREEKNYSMNWKPTTYSVGALTVKCGPEEVVER